MTDAHALAGQMRRDLYAIIDTFALTLEPSRTGAGVRVTASREPPLPISVDILDARAMCCSRLAGWALVVLEERDLHADLQAGDATGLATFLIVHVEWLAAFEAGADAADEIAATAHDLAAIAAPHRRDWTPLGICPLVLQVDGHPAGCTGTVRAYDGCDPYCDHCGTQGSAGWWERVMFPGVETTRLLTAPELAVFLHRQFGRAVSECSIRQWVTRDIITKAGVDDAGRTLFDRGAVAYSLERRKILA